MLDFVGRSTFKDDWDQMVGEALPNGLNWLFSTPWWVPGALCAVLVAYMMWLNLPTAQKVTSRDQGHKGSTELVAEVDPATPLEAAYSKEMAMRLFRLTDYITQIESQAAVAGVDEFRLVIETPNADKDIFCAKGTAAEKWRSFQLAAKMVNTVVNKPEPELGISPEELFAIARRDQKLKRNLRAAASDLIAELAPIS